jgi:Oxysterol-binding protein
MAASDGSGGFVSAVKSFIGSLKLGEDLTKKAMPARLMLPRSMLELQLELMMPRFYLLIAASQEDSPEERALGVLRYFLFNYFASKKIVKKPFNPVLGEVYACATCLDDEEDDDSASGSDSPEASEFGRSCSTRNEARARVSEMREKLSDRSFGGTIEGFAQSVSHHPPAFVAQVTHPNSGITSTRAFVSSVKFHGTYAKVDHVGDMSVTLPLPAGVAGKDSERPLADVSDNSSSDDDARDALGVGKADYGSFEGTLPPVNSRGEEFDREHYVFTKPADVFFRIFRMTTEYGGTSHLFCAETGYGAEIKFEEKPTFGGRWHDVSGYVYRAKPTADKDQKKASSRSKGAKVKVKKLVEREKLFELSGNWKEGMTLTATGSGEVRQWIPAEWPLLQWDENVDFAENTTRNVWGDAIDALYQGDMGLAGEAKGAIEENQRALRKRGEEKMDHCLFVEHDLGLWNRLPEWLRSLAEAHNVDLRTLVAKVINPDIPQALSTHQWRTASSDETNTSSSHRYRTLIQDECP